MTQAMKVLMELEKTEEDVDWRKNLAGVISGEYSNVNVARVFITFSGNGKVNKMRLTTSDEETRNTLKKFLQTCGIFSMTNYIEEVKKQKLEQETRWSKLRRSTVKNHMIQIFSDQLASLSKGASKDEVLTFIMARILTKNILTEDIVTGDSRAIDRINGVVLRRGKVSYDEKGYSYSMEAGFNIYFQGENSCEN